LAAAGSACALLQESGNGAADLIDVDGLEQDEISRLLNRILHRRIPLLIHMEDDDWNCLPARPDDVKDLENVTGEGKQIDQQQCRMRRQNELLERLMLVSRTISKFPSSSRERLSAKSRSGLKTRIRLRPPIRTPGSLSPPCGEWFSFPFRVPSFDTDTQSLNLHATRDLHQHP